MAAIIKTSRVRMSLIVLALVVSGFPAQPSFDDERRGSNHVAPVANDALALGGSIIGGINASGFLLASHALEIGRICGIRLLRTQSASCIVHGTGAVVCATDIASAAQTGIDPGRQFVD